MRAKGAASPINTGAETAEHADGVAARAAAVAAALSARGISGLAVTLVDNSGITRVKAIPAGRLARAATTGIGAPPVMDAFGMDDSIAAVGSPVGDLRLIPDLDALVPLAAQRGWAWAPADRVHVDGTAYLGCQRSFARQMRDRARAHGLEIRLAFETEWIVDAGHGDDLAAATTGPAYGMGRLIDLSDYCHDLLEALAAEGVEVEQLHPEYAPSQMEVSVAALDPLGAADRAVLVRQTIRAVGAAHGYRTSLSPAVTPGGVGSGAHVHLSAWRDARNLHGRQEEKGPDPDGDAWLAGILDALPGLVAVGAPSVASYLRLQPQRWSAPWHCWGRENREAALRLIDGSGPTPDSGANVEVKAIDASANPYLVVGALIAAGLDGIERGLTLPAEVTVDPASLDDDARRASGITRLPTTLPDALAAFEANPVVSDAMGDTLAATWMAVRQAEVDRFAGASDEAVALASRWVW